MYDLHRASIYHSLMTIKLDMEKIYDRMFWSFSEKTLEDFAFHSRWISWIMACIERLSFAILINGTPSDFFYSTIGLQQDCITVLIYYLYRCLVVSFACYVLRAGFKPLCPSSQSLADLTFIIYK